MSVEEQLRARLDRALAQEAAILRLSAAGEQPFEQRLKDILRVGAATLSVGRLSYWSLVETPARMRCDALYLAREDQFESGIELPQHDYPRYFAALLTGRPVVAHDARLDPRSNEFTEPYLEPLGIGAMLDVPVFTQGKLTGVVCHEHLGGAREWSEDEQLFALSIGQLIALAIEARFREAAEAALRESEARFRTIVEAAPVPMLLSSLPDGEFLYGNRALAQVLGLPQDRVLGNHTRTFYANPEERAGLLAEVLDKGVVANRELELKRPNGPNFTALMSIQLLEFAGKRALLTGFIDLTVQKQMEHTLRHMALHDALTGLPNRALFFELLRNEISRAHRDARHRFGVLYLDLDGFKAVNDSYGHDAGDELLVEVARRLKACLRDTDTPARMGGDEFTALLVGVRDAQEATQIADRLRQLLAAPVRVGERELEITGSIGVALADGSTREPNELLRRADDEMYREKQAARAARASFGLRQKR